MMMNTGALTQRDYPLLTVKFSSKKCVLKKYRRLQTVAGTTLKYGYIVGSKAILVLKRSSPHKKLLERERVLHKIFPAADISLHIPKPPAKLSQIRTLEIRKSRLKGLKRQIEIIKKNILWDTEMIVLNNKTITIVFDRSVSCDKFFADRANFFFDIFQNTAELFVSESRCTNIGDLHQIRRRF